jgi:uncharacterized protein YqeY
MTIYETVKSDLKSARLARDSKEVISLSTLLGEMDLTSKITNNVKIVSDVEATQVVKKFLKNIDEIVKVAGSNEEIEREKMMLLKYLPHQMSEENIRNALFSFIKTTTSPSLGDMMGYMKKNYSGEYDGKFVSIIAKSILDDMP